MKPESEPAITEAQGTQEVTRESIGCLMAIAFCTGLMVGAIAMFYLVKAEIILPAFDVRPYLVAWLVVVAAWVVGRVMKSGHHDEKS